MVKTSYEISCDLRDAVAEAEKRYSGGIAMKIDCIDGLCLEPAEGSATQLFIINPFVEEATDYGFCTWGGDIGMDDESGIKLNAARAYVVSYNGQAHFAFELPPGLKNKEQYHKSALVNPKILEVIDIAGAKARRRRLEGHDDLEALMVAKALV